MKNIEIPEDILERARRQYGDIVDSIGIRPMKCDIVDADCYQLSTMFYTRTAIGTRDGDAAEVVMPRVIDRCVMELCNDIEKTVLDKPTDAFTTPSLDGSGLKFYRTTNIEEGCIIIHPKTYDALPRIGV